VCANLLPVSATEYATGSTVVASPEASPPVDPRRWLILAVLCAALLIVGIDGTIVNIALPTLVREIGASNSQLQWIVDAYTIVFASFLLIAGNTGDRIGRKRCLLAGLVVFAAGSFGCSRVSSAEPLIVLRGVQGLGAAFIMPATLSIITNVFRDPNERSRAIALWAGVSGLGIVIGPLAGGFLLEHYWWGAIFLINVPIAVVAIVAVVAVVPESKDPEAPALDLIGTLLSTIGLISLLFGIIEGSTRGWGDPVIVGCFAAAAILLTVFVIWERRTDHPILDVRFFANPRFSAASIAVTLVFFAMFGTMFFVSQYLQFVLGYTALQSGVALIPVAGALMVAAPLSAKLVEWIGTKAVVATGLGVVAVALFVFSFATTTSGYGLVAAVLILVGVGMGLAMAPATDSIMGSLPPERAGVGSAVNDTTREVGGALGVAILGTITASSYASTITSNPQFASLQAVSPDAAQAVKNSVGGAAIVAQSLPADIGHALTTTANQAFVDALSHTVYVGAGVAILGVVVALVFLPSRPVEAAAEPGLEDLVVEAARGLPNELVERRNIGRATLELLADAGMASLTFNGIATRSGVSTVTVRRYWTSRVDAVVDTITDAFAEFPIPDTGDVRADLETYLTEEQRRLGAPRARAVIAYLAAAAANDATLEDELQARLVQPLRARFIARLQAAQACGDLDRDIDIDVTADLLAGPVYYRALITGEGLDGARIAPTLDIVLTGL
jgi:EmrB/QacA subfamily drug resistance transporter